MLRRRHVGQLAPACDLDVMCLPIDSGNGPLSAYLCHKAGA